LLRPRWERQHRRNSNSFNEIASPHRLSPRLRTTPIATITAGICDQRKGV
jgi:hypothetical protein